VTRRADSTCALGLKLLRLSSLIADNCLLVLFCFVLLLFSFFPLVFFSHFLLSRVSFLALGYFRKASVAGRISGVVVDVATGEADEGEGALGFAV